MANTYVAVNDRGGEMLACDCQYPPVKVYYPGGAAALVPEGARCPECGGEPWRQECEGCYKTPCECLPDDAGWAEFRAMAEGADLEGLAAQFAALERAAFAVQ